MLHRVYNQGEIPSIAHGWLSVLALTPGRKWSKLLDLSTLETARLEIALWQKLEPQPAKHMNPRKVRTTMHRRLCYVSATETIRKAFCQLREASA